MNEFGGRSEISELGSGKAGYCLPGRASKVSVETALSYVGAEVSGTIERGGSPRGTLQGVYGHESGTFLKIDGEFYNLGHVSRLRCESSATGGKNGPLVEQLLSLASVEQDFYLPAGSVQGTSLTGLGVHPSAIMLRIGDQLGNLSHIGEIHDPRSSPAAMWGEDESMHPPVRPAAEELTGMIASFVGSHAVELYTPSSICRSGQIRSLAADSTAVLLECDDERSGDIKLVNLAHVGTISFPEPNFEDASMWSDSPGVAAEASGPPPIRPLRAMLQELVNHRIEAFTPFQVPASGVLRGIETGPNGSSVILDIDGRKIDLVDVAEISRVQSPASESFT